MAAFISDELFHFVGRSHPHDHEANYETLKLILTRGCISHPPHADDWGTTGYRLDLSKRLHAEELLVPTVTCFCDIPFASLSLHLQKYGFFGVALSRHLFVRHGARPVMYVPTRSDDFWSARGGGTDVLASLEATFRGLRSQLAPPIRNNGRSLSVPVKEPSTPEAAIEHLERTLALEVLAYVKPFDSTLQVSDPNYYYSEREWRKFGNMRFQQGDVTRVVVHPQFVERLKAYLPAYSQRICASPE